jgi:glutamate carboxypeptidase
MVARRIVSVALTLLASGAAHAQTPTAAERTAVRAVDAHNAGMERLLEELVNINSGTFNPAGVVRVGQVLERQLRELGFETHWINEDAVHRAPSLMAVHAGKRGKRVLLIGHMDTVFEPSDPFQHYTRSGNTATGPGVGDMKGGLVIIVASLAALKDSGLLADANVSVFFTGDEEAAGEPLELARKDLITAAQQADAALSFEGDVIRDGIEYASVARRGASQWELHVQGNAAHSGGIFDKDTGDGAAFELSRILARFHDTLREPNMTYSVGLALAGAHIKVQPDGSASLSGKSNIVPPEGTAIGDLRVLTPQQLERVEDRMQAIVAESLPGTHSTLIVQPGYPPMAPTPGNEALLRALNAASASIHAGTIQALDPMLRGAGDASFIAPYIDVLDGLGLAGGGAHAAGEHADLTYLPLQSKRIALLIALLTREPRAAR